jgi:hypothetical protein
LPIPRKDVRTTLLELRRELEAYRADHGSDEARKRITRFERYLDAFDGREDCRMIAADIDWMGTGDDLTWQGDYEHLVGHIDEVLRDEP